MIHKRLTHINARSVCSIDFILPRIQKFGKRIKFLRLDRGLTQLELAEILDMSPNFIGMIERGERNTTVENVFKIARALGIKPSNLFEEL